MSIDRERFEESSEEELEEYSAVDHVLGFLAANESRAFKVSEIARQTDPDEGAVSTALTRLKNRELVKHKGQYWAITADETRRENYEGYARATALFNDQYGSEDREAWKEHAPEDEHPTVSGDVE